MNIQNLIAWNNKFKLAWIECIRNMFHIQTILWFACTIWNLELPFFLTRMVLSYLTHYAEYAPWQLKKVCQYLICREKTNKHKIKIENNTGIPVFTRLVKIAIAVVLLYNAYVLQSSTVSRKSEALIVRNSQKKEWICFVFYCFERTLQLVILNFRTTGPIQVRFSAKCTSPMSTSIK